jgi:hypothetical protein
MGRLIPNSALQVSNRGFGIPSGEMRWPKHTARPRTASARSQDDLAGIASGVGASAWLCTAVLRSGIAVQSPARKRRPTRPWQDRSAMGLSQHQARMPQPGIRSRGPRLPLTSAQPSSEPAAGTSEQSTTRTAAPRLSLCWGVAAIASAAATTMPPTARPITRHDPIRSASEPRSARRTLPPSTQTPSHPQSPG